MSADSKVVRIVAPTGAAPSMTLQDIVDSAPRWEGPDRLVVRQFFMAVVNMCGFAVLFGLAGGLILYELLTRALAYLT